MLGERLGNWLSWQRVNSGRWGRLALAFLALTLLLNLVLHPHHPHFEAERIPGFWALFGLVFAVVLAFLMKKVVGKIIGMPEDFYQGDK
jgi:hypothetical protein